MNAVIAEKYPGVRQLKFSELHKEQRALIRKWRLKHAIVRFYKVPATRRTIFVAVDEAASDDVAAQVALLILDMHMAVQQRRRRPPVVLQ